LKNNNEVLRGKQKEGDNAKKILLRLTSRCCFPL
jgi:hypothetical protein